MAHALHRESKRTSKRQRIYTTAHVRCPAKGETEYVALTRDLGAGGMFLFSNFVPSLGANVSIRLVRENTFIQYEGEVLRVEKKVEGAAVGIAVRFLPQPSSAA